MNDRFPDTPEELRQMLHKGMGRAVLFLLSQDLSQYREMILDACLRNYSYDRQCEESRAEYMYQLARAAGDDSFYRSRILDSLLAAPDDSDVGQLLDFAVLFAREDDETAKEAIYERLRRSVSDPQWDGDTEAVELDGVDGLIRVLDIIGSNAGDHPVIDIDRLVEDAVDASGAEAVSAAIRDSAATSPNVAAALAAVRLSPDSVVKQVARRLKRMRAHRRNNFSEGTTWEEAKDSLKVRAGYLRWSQVASDEEFVKAAEAVDASDEPDRLQWHLWAFKMRPFPLDPGILVDLVDHQDERVALSALVALQIIADEQVRDLFGRLRADARWSDRAVGLLRRNYRAGDELIIADMLERETDPDKLHMLAMHARQVYKEQPVPEGMTAMLLAYEKTPCSMCRCSCFEAIEALGPVPDWMIEECLYDAYEPTRELAAKLKQV